MDIGLTCLMHVLTSPKAFRVHLDVPSPQCCLPGLCILSRLARLFQRAHVWN
jgi:hypothetical protein